MLKRIRDNFRKKYLLILLVIPALFMFTGTKGEGVKFESWEEIEEYVVYRASRGDIDYEVGFTPAFNDTDFKDPNEGRYLSDVWCEKVRRALNNYDEYIASVSFCSIDGIWTGSGTFIGRYKITNNLGQATNNIDYDEIREYFDNEITKLINADKNTFEVVLETRNLVESMVKYNGSSEYNFGHYLLGDPRTRHPILDPAAHNVLFSLALSRLNLEFKIIRPIKSSWDEVSQWIIIKIEDNWYHCPADTSISCLISDSEMLKHYNAWDTNKYPAAPVSYNGSQTSSKLELVPEKKPLPRPDLNYSGEGGEYYRDENIELKMKGVSPWAYDTVYKAINEDLVPSKLTYGYKYNIVRKDFALLIVEMFEKLTNKRMNLPSTNPFKDVNNKEDVEVLKVYEHGIVSGVTKTEFARYDDITREQIAVMFARTINALEKEGITSEIIEKAKKDTNKISFADENEISVDWAGDEVQLLNKIGILNGVGKSADGKIIVNPKGYATEEQAIILAYRLYELYK